MTSRFFSIVLALFLCSTSVSGSGQSVILGVLEDNQGHFAGEPNFRTVRVVFQKKGLHWQAFQSNCPDSSCLKTIASKYPPEVTWTIAFDGRNVGQVTSRAPQEFRWYSSVGQQDITRKGPIPTIGERSSEFGGFTDAAVYRPLVANSQPYFKDPQMWKPVHLPTGLVGLLRNHFRKKFPEVANCANPDENVAKPWHYRDEDIRILKSYTSKNNWSTVQLRLEEYRCDGPADDPFSDQWFVISPQREIKFLGEGMWLVDAGDYDNDGKSELLFSIDRYNRGGYELLYDDFSKRAVFEFSYH